MGSGRGAIPPARSVLGAMVDAFHSRQRRRAEQLAGDVTLTITPRDADTGDRLSIPVSALDRDRVLSALGAPGRFADVTDRVTGKEWRIYSAPCSNDCYCDARAFPRPRVSPADA